MNTAETVLKHLLHARDQIDVEDGVDWTDQLPDDIEELWLLRSMTVRYSQALRLVDERYRQALAKILGKGGTARVGDDFIKYSATPKLVPLESFEPWLQTLTTAEVLQVLPKASKFRKTGLAAVAEARGIPVETLEGSLYTVEWGDPSVSAMPVGSKYAPKYAAVMASGEVRRKVVPDMEPEDET